MPKRIAPLTDTRVRTVRLGKDPQKLFNGGGLFLLVTPSGEKLWNFKYRFERKEKKLSFGAYPDISLAEARQRRELARSLLAHGMDPSVTKKAQKVADEIQAFRQWKYHLSEKARQAPESQVPQQKQLPSCPAEIPDGYQSTRRSPFSSFPVSLTSSLQRKVTGSMLYNHPCQIVTNALLFVFVLLAAATLSGRSVP